jgi:hypothetical protein
MLDPNHRRLTIADAIDLGFRLQSFREVHAGSTGAQLRTFGFLRLWHAENHRKAHGANHRWRYESLLQEAREAFRMSRVKGCGVGATEFLTRENSRRAA